MKSLTRWGLTTGLLVALAGGTVGTLVALEHMRPQAVRATELSYLPKGKYIKIAALGYDQLVADLLWLKALQHFGESLQHVAGQAPTKDGYLWAYHAVDVVTDVDPDFLAAFLATGTILGVWAGLPNESIAILEKGVRHHPEVWQLQFLLGYDYFYELCDTVRAAEYLRTASGLPGAPEYLPKLAARMSVEAGDPHAALEFLGRFAQQAKDERTQEALAHRMKEVIAERDLMFLEDAVRRYEARYRKRPGTLKDLIDGGMIVRVPEEPLGGVYVLRPDGTVLSTGLEERLRVHYREGLNVSCQRFRRAPS